MTVELVGIAGVIPIAIVGVGKIARDQHIPTIAASDRFALAAVVTQHHPVEGVPAFATITEMMKACPGIRAVAICTPPLGRLAVVREALACGLDVMIEKPPAATLGEAEAIVAAASAGQVLFTAWHSRHAAAVRPAAAWLSSRRIRSVAVVWKEDVRVWHPGQEWIWSPGIGVFDPGINALSILTRVVPRRLFVGEALLRFPANRPAPIAADFTLTNHDDAAISVAFDFDQRGEQNWDIAVETDNGSMHLRSGGSQLVIDGTEIEVATSTEYESVYGHFATLIDARRSDADIEPFRLVADVFMLATRETVGPFDWHG
jgi:D-galactose 1-dehydrogenase